MRLAQELKHTDRDRYLVSLFVPRENGARDAMQALFVFHQEIAKVADVVSNPMLGRIRLQWWRDTLDDLYAGTTTPLPPQGALPALKKAIASHALSPTLFSDLIAAREKNMDGIPLSADDFLSYAEDSGAPLLLLMAEILTVRSPALDPVLRDLAAAQACVSSARALPFVTTAQQEEQVATHLHSILNHADRRLSAAEKILGQRTPATLPFFVIAAMTRHYLDVLTRHAGDVFHPRVQRPISILSLLRRVYF